MQHGVYSVEHKNDGSQPLNLKTSAVYNSKLTFHDTCNLPGSKMLSSSKLEVIVKITARHQMANSNVQEMETYMENETQTLCPLVFAV